jgi:oligopeptide transport system permease protein
MLRDLSCPKCGAPVTVESADHGVVVCSFCNASSVIEIDAQKEPQLKLERSDKDSAPAISGTSLWKDAWRRLLKNKLAVFGMIVLGVMIVLVAIGPVILRWLTGITADYIPANGDLIKSFPPSLQHPMGTDEQGRDILARVLQGGRISLAVGLISTIVSLAVGVSYGAIAGYLGGKIDNVMMRIVDIIYAIPYILIVIVLLSVFGGPNTQVLIAALPAILVGLIVGVAGILIAVNIYRRIFGEGVSLSLGDTVKRFAFGLLEAVVVVSLILLAVNLVSRSGFGSSIGESYGNVVSLGMSQIFLLFFALGLVSWLTMARVVRGQILSLKNQEFVSAAKATGVSTFGIIFRHLVPNALGPVIVYATLTVPSVMLSEAFLSYLGLGVQAPYASWGSLAADGVKNIAIFPWQLIFPGVTMALTLFSLNFLGDGLRDALDPQTRKF